MLGRNGGSFVTGKIQMLANRPGPAAALSLQMHRDQAVRIHVAQRSLRQLPLEPVQAAVKLGKTYPDPRSRDRGPAGVDGSCENKIREQLRSVRTCNPERYLETDAEPVPRPGLRYPLDGTWLCGTMVAVFWSMIPKEFSVFGQDLALVKRLWSAIRFKLE
jgi:hypothetical protein